MKNRAEFSPPHVEKLVASSKNGDTVAFDHLVRLYKERVWAFVARRLADPVEAEDITQETFVKAYRAMATFRGASAFYTWLCCIAGNLTIDAMRKRQRHLATYSLDAPLETQGVPLERDFAAPSYREPDNEVEAAEVQREVHRAIRDLEPKLRTVVVLYELQGFNYAEIAMLMGCPLGTVKSRMFRARNELKRHLLHSHARQLLSTSFVTLEGPKVAHAQPARSAAY